MRILLAIEVIHPGGAETFVLRLSQALQRKGHDVRVFIFYKDGFNDRLYETLAAEVPLHIAAIPAYGMLHLADRVMFKLKIDFSLRDVFIKSSLKRLMRRHKIEVVHSNLLKVDRIVLQAADKLGVPVVNTVHGDYLQFFNKLAQGQVIPLLNYHSKARRNLASLRRIVCISDKQLQFFHAQFPEVAGKLTKIYNGYDGVAPETSGNTLREKLGIGTDAFVFGMVSRGIASKGWETAILAFIALKAPNAHLVLVGDGEHLQHLSREYAVYKQIHFVGGTEKPLEWISMCDAGLLPTTYPSESLPTVVIEYLCCGKPVIASDAGEIVNMLHADGNVAGIITPITNGTVNVAELTEAMRQYLTDQTLYQTHCQHTAACYAQFDMDACIAHYTTVYEGAINE